MGDRFPVIGLVGHELGPDGEPAKSGHSAEARLLARRGASSVYPAISGPDVVGAAAPGAHTRHVAPNTEDGSIRGELSAGR
jgi:hypothetical protein